MVNTYEWTIERWINKLLETYIGSPENFIHEALNCLRKNHQSFFCIKWIIECVFMQCFFAIKICLHWGWYGDSINFSNTHISCVHKHVFPSIYLPSCTQYTFSTRIVLLIFGWMSFVFVFVHFCETFIGEYEQKLEKKNLSWVWYVLK